MRFISTGRGIFIALPFEPGFPLGQSLQVVRFLSDRI